MMLYSIREEDCYWLLRNPKWNKYKTMLVFLLLKTCSFSCYLWTIVCLHNLPGHPNQILDHSHFFTFHIKLVYKSCGLCILILFLIHSDLSLLLLSSVRPSLLLVGVLPKASWLISQLLSNCPSRMTYLKYEWPYYCLLLLESFNYSHCLLSKIQIP